MTRTRTRVLLASVVFAVLLAQVLLYPGIDTLVSALGAGPSLDAGMWFLAVEFAAFVAFAVPWGVASDVTGRRVPFIVAGALGGAAGYVLLAVLPTRLPIPFDHVLLLRACQGAATIGAFSLAISMLMDLEGGHGRNMGAAGIAIGLGTAVGAPIGGRLYEVGPFVPLYAAGAVMIGAAVLAAFAADRAPSGNREGVAAILAEFAETPTLALPYTFGFVDRLSAGFVALVGTFYFRTAFGLGPGATGLTLALFFAPFALLQYPFGIVSDRVGRTVPIVAGSVLYGVGVILVGAASTVRLAQLALVFVGIVGAFMAPATMALVTDLAGETRRGVAMAGFNIAGSLGFLAGILVGGTVAGDYGFEAAFYVAGGIEVAIALVTVPAFLRMTVERSTTFGGG